ncbi:MAG TPA: HPr family phosphocarrier protein [Armatimonadota bacterium]|nr:HPr family phosphocarrier protein [Armatimonadota bacterium]
MPAQSVEVVNEVGLHATPLAQFVSKARAFPETGIRVRRGERQADGKSLIGMLALEALKGTTITIETDGPAAEEALAALVALVAGGFGAAR